MADGIVKYMRNKAGPASKELKSIEDVKKFLDNTEHSVVGRFTFGMSFNDFFIVHLLFHVIIRSISHVVHLEFLFNKF